MFLLFEILTSSLILELKYKEEFDVHVTMHRDNVCMIKPTRCSNFSNLFFE